MKCLVPLLTLAVALGLASPCSAQLVGPVHVVPVIAKTEGVAGTDWVTSISMSNVSDGIIDVTAMFMRENTPNLPPLVPLEIFVLSPGQTMTVEDVLGTWFPFQGDTKGVLMLLADLRDGGEDDYARLATTARIFNNANPAATYGQGVVSDALGLMLAPGRLVLSGARYDGIVRSNVGVVNLSLSETDFIVTTFAANGVQIDSVRKTVPPFSMSQWSLEQLGAPALTTPGRVEVEIDPDTVTWDPCGGDPGDLWEGAPVFLAYMSRVEQATSDADFSQGRSDWKPYSDLCGGQPTLVPDLLRGSLR